MERQRLNRRQLLGLATAAVTVSGCSTLGLFAPERVTLPTSAVHDVPAASGRRYQLWVDVPADYADTTRAYPVVVVTDPSFAFVTARMVRNLTGQRGRNIEDFILVGLVPDPDIPAALARRRDYTPSNPLLRPNPDLTEYTGKAYGEAEAYRRYVEQTAMPFVAENYRADMKRTTLLGHSYGALFGAYVLLTQPQMFVNYILGSPSLWFDNGIIFDFEREYARSHRDLIARVHMVTGSFETGGAGPRYYTQHDLVADMRRFESQLKARGYPGLSISAEIAEGEDHYTVFPDVVNRGLIKLLPGRGPYTSG